MRKISFAEAIREGTEQCMAQDPRVYVMGLGVPDPGAIFGTTAGLQDKFGVDRVMDMPLAENGMTGIAIGSAIAGMRPVMTHQRVDFMLLAVEQIVNHAAKMHYTSNGAFDVPLVIRAIIGRGWGQGPQHMQSLYSWFANIPGLKVVAPYSPEDAKGLMAAAIEDNNPVLFFEHRWLHHLVDSVPENYYTTPIGKAKILRSGGDVTIATISHMTHEALAAATLLEGCGISAEVIDVRSIRPIDSETILNSVRKTQRFVTAEPGWRVCGFCSELISIVVENAFDSLKCAPQRFTHADYPLPASPALSEHYFPRALDIARGVLSMFGRPEPSAWANIVSGQPHDTPNTKFTGPF